MSDVFKMRFEDDEVERYSIYKGDLIICEGGEPGRCAVLQSEVLYFRKSFAQGKSYRCSARIFVLCNMIILVSLVNA